MRFKVKALLVIVVLVYSKYVVDKLKKTLNNALSNFAQKIQVNTGSFLVWGETQLPEEIRKEIEDKNINKEWQ